MKTKQQGASRGSLVELSRDVFGHVCSADDSVYGGYGANQGFVILEESVLVFDTGFSSSHATSLIRAISSVTDKRVRYIVNSHDHSDHVFGNSAFARKYGARNISVIAHVNCRSRIENMGKRRLKAYRSRNRRLDSILSSVEITFPGITYSDINLKVSIEGTDFLFIHPTTGAHTLGDTMLAIPKKGTLFAGDVVWNSYLPNLEDANLDGWIDTLEQIDLATYIKCLPGHGEECSEKQIRDFTGYLKEVQQRLLSLPQDEKDISVLRKCFAIEGTHEWKLQQIIDSNVQSLLGST